MREEGSLKAIGFIGLLRIKTCTFVINFCIYPVEKEKSDIFEIKF